MGLLTGLFLLGCVAAGDKLNEIDRNNKYRQRKREEIERWYKAEKYAKEHYKGRDLEIWYRQHPKPQDILGLL